MTTLGGDLRTELVDTAAIAALVDDRVFQNKVPALDERSAWPDLPFIWFRQAGADGTDCLKPEQGELPWRVYFDLECADPTVGGELELAAAVIDALNGLTGTLGSRSIVMVYVVDHADDYFSRVLEADEGLNVAALQVQIYTGD